MLLVVLAAATLAVSQALPLGAPTAACEDMFPVGHNVSAQTSPAPYTFTVMPMMDHFMVSLSGNPNPFRGFYFQARATPGGLPVGRFELVDGADPVRLRECSNLDDAASHNFNLDKSTVSVRWFGDATGLTFYATVVQEVETFWTGLTATAM